MKLVFNKDLLPNLYTCSYCSPWILLAVIFFVFNLSIVKFQDDLNPSILAIFVLKSIHPVKILLQPSSGIYWLQMVRGGPAGSV